MHHSHTTRAAVRAAHRTVVWALLALGAIALPGLARPAAAQDAGMAARAEEEEEEEVPHPFFTHMGLPEGVGVYNLRVLGTATRADGSSDGDFAFHFETGLTSRIGLHVRNDRFRTNDKTEAMFQFTAFVSKNGMNGFAPLIEFEFPTRSGASRVNTLAGFTTSLGSSAWAFNQVVHYDPREDMLDGSVALVFRANRFLFPVVEVLGEGGKGQSSVANVLGGIKVRLREGINLGFAYQLPLTNRKEFSSQLAFGPEVGWTR